MSAKLGKGLGMPGWRIKDQIAGLSSEAKEFAIYLDCYEPGICKFMADHGYTASDLYHQMIDSFRKMASGKNLSGHEANLLAIHCICFSGQSSSEAHTLFIVVFLWLERYSALSLWDTRAG